MNLIQNQTFDEERALYGHSDLRVEDCRFDGLADGESALKECRRIDVRHCFFNLRYPLWHVHSLQVSDSEMTEGCRAALWYCEEVTLRRIRMHGIKALRECRQITVEDCDILSPEFGWLNHQITMSRCTAESEYFMMRSRDLQFHHVRMKGKYSFQYIENAVFEHCEFDTKDAFWHARNVVVRDCVIKGEYLGWYSDHLTLERCRIIGTQPLCYCRNLKLIDCEMVDTDLAFERSEVQAVITTPVLSIKNPLSGTIQVPAVKEIIHDLPEAAGQIVLSETTDAISA